MSVFLMIKSPSSNLAAVLTDPQPSPTCTDVDAMCGDLRAGSLPPSLGVLILVHSSPCVNKESKPLPHLSQALKVSPKPYRTFDLISRRTLEPTRSVCPSVRVSVSCTSVRRSGLT